MTTKFTAGLALAALMLAGCGGGSDNLRDERDALQAELDEVRQEAEELQDEVDDLEEEVAGLEEELDDRPTDADVTAAQQEAELAAQEAELAAQEAREEAERRIEEVERQGNLRQRIPGLLTALGAATLTEESGVTVEHMRGESREFGPDAFYTRGSAAPSISGWSSASFTRETSDDIDTLYLYTNIQPPNTRPFWKVHGTDPVTMDADLQEVAAGSSASPDADTDDGTEGHQYSELTISGRLGGTSGTFTCSGCTGVVGDETNGIDSHVTFTGGKPEFVAVGSWTFTPTQVTAAHQRDQDETYLYYGIWARHPKDASGTPGFRWIAGGGDEGPGRTTATLTDYASLTGRATFGGGAIGQYAIDKTSVGGQVKTGTFTAKATLRANFDDNELSGQITDFREGDSSLTGWNLYLQGADSDTPATLGAAGTTGTPTTSGTIDGVNAMGAWAARLYGVDNAAAPAGTQCPNGCAADVAGVAGWFNARDADPARFVAIGGAFGAQKQ